MITFEQQASGYQDSRAQGSLLNWTLKVGKHIRLVLQVQSERRILNSLDPHQLSDIGIDRRQATQESERSLLDLPATRRP